jgi:hypothetical protein
VVGGEWVVRGEMGERWEQYGERDTGMRGVGGGGERVRLGRSELYEGLRRVRRTSKNMSLQKEPQHWPPATAQAE